MSSNNTHFLFGSLTTFLFRWRNRHFLSLDALILLLLPAVALALRTDTLWPQPRYQASLLVITLVFVAVKLVIFYLTGLYNRFWRYASIDELAQILIVGIVAMGVQTIIFFVILRPLGWIAADFPRSLPLLDGLLAISLVGGVRYTVRLAERLRQLSQGDRGARRVIVVGAGAAGIMMLTEMQRNPRMGLHPVALIDDDERKHGITIRGVPVVGGRHQIQATARRARVTEVIIAMPTAPGKAIREIVAICEKAAVKVKIIPGIYELLDNAVSVKQLRNVDIEDLLRREPVQTDIAAVRQLVQGKRILVTGGGGSIGGELCRQILRSQPAELVILGHGENSLFAIQNELRRTIKNQGHTLIHTLIADIRFPERINHIFEQYRPEIVFHAAAHKHVPLMEENPAEAITNNVLGTQYLLEAAQATNVGHFVMISTDKAVNPTSVMGASKRVAELLVDRAARRSGRPYVAVRFGNVLGSRGSVVLTFKQQIAAGGPVTVTDPEMVRYFMTIPEAVQLVLQAAVLGKGGEVFVLDMGEPVKIVDLARDLIRLSGLEVGQDIDITFTGRRAGEKLFEEIFTSGEAHQRTHHEKIFISKNDPENMPHHLDTHLINLSAAAQCNDKNNILRELQSLIPEFQHAQARDKAAFPAPDKAALFNQDTVAGTVAGRVRQEPVLGPDGLVPQ